MLSLKETKEILGKKAENYSDEEIIKIRDFLYFLAHIECEALKKQQNNSKTKNLVKY